MGLVALELVVPLDAVVVQEFRTLAIVHLLAGLLAWVDLQIRVVTSA